jgi:branched-chain amino acid transport system permease protein
MISWPASKPRTLVLLASVALVLVLAPFLLSPYAVITLTRVLVFALLAVSLDLLVGYAGLPSLGHGAYFGAGAYAAGWVTMHATPSAPLALLVGVLAGASTAILAGSVAVRSSGVFFLMLTLAVGEIVQQLAESWHDVTGGSNGLYGIPAVRVAGLVLVEPHLVYWWVLAAFSVAAVGVAAIAASPFGDTLRGIRDNEARMSSLGYRVYRYKLAAFIVSGAVAGMAGALLSAHQRLVTPEDVGLGTSILVLVAVTIGGEALWGACLGAALVVLIRDTLGASLSGRGSLILGITFVAVVYLLPGGLARAKLARARA